MPASRATPLVASQRSRTRSPDLDLSAVQLVDIVSNVVQQLDRDGQRVQIVMERAPTVLADSAKLAHATASLLRGALAASPDHEPIEIEIAARCLARRHETPGADCSAAVSVAIRDRTTKNAKTPDAQSLDTVRDIMQLHKGRLWYTSEPERGRTFGFCLASEEAA